MPIPRDPDRPRWEWSGVPGFVAPLKQGDYREARAYHYYKTYRKSTGLPFSPAMKSVARKLHIAWIEEIVLREHGLLVDAAPVDDGTPRTIQAAREAFEKAKRKSLSKLAFRDIRQAMAHLFPDDEPIELDVETIERSLIESMEQTDLAQSTLRKHLIQIKRICRYAMDRGWLDANPVELVGVPREPKKVDVDVWSRDEVEQIVEWMRSHCKSPMAEWYALLVEWQSLTAMRPGETLKMRRRHVEAHALRIPKTKTGKARTLPIGGTEDELEAIAAKQPKRIEWQESMRRILSELVRLYDEHHAEMSGRRGINWPRHHLWPMRNLDKFRRQFGKCKEDLDLRDGRLYDLRATAEDYWVWELGFGMRTICAYAGHSPSVYYAYYEARYGSAEHRKLLQV